MVECYDRFEWKNVRNVVICSTNLSLEVLRLDDAEDDIYYYIKHIV